MGALTIKPYAFQYRPWEMERVLIPNLLSVFPETLSVHFKNQKILRVLNPSNFIGLTNRVRFSEKLLRSLFFQGPIRLNKAIDFSFFFNCVGVLTLCCFPLYSINFSFKYGAIVLFLLGLDLKRFFSVEYKVTVRPKFYSNIVELMEHFASKFFLSKALYKFKSANRFVPVPQTFEFASRKNQVSTLNVFTTLDLRVYFVDFLLQLKKQNLNQNKVTYNNLGYNTNIFYTAKIKHNLYFKSSSIFETQISALPFLYTGVFFQVFLRSFLLEPSTYFVSNSGTLIFKNINLEVPFSQTISWFGFSKQFQHNSLIDLKFYVQGFFLVHCNDFFLNSFGCCIPVFWLKT